MENKTQLQQREREHPVTTKHEARSEPGTYSGPYFEPQVDIYETDDALTLVADLPGVQADEVDTDIRDNVLTVTAKVKPVDAKWKPAYREYAEGHYVRQFRLGQQIDQTRVTASLKDGVLTLTLPKSDGAKPRRIEVKAG